MCYCCCAAMGLLHRSTIKRSGIAHDAVDNSKGKLISITCKWVDGATVEVNHVSLCDVVLLQQPAPASGLVTQQSHNDKTRP